MIEPRRRPHLEWSRDRFITDNNRAVIPLDAREHFIVNTSRMIIMRALVSSRNEMKQLKS